MKKIDNSGISKYSAFEKIELKIGAGLKIKLPLLPFGVALI